MWVVEYPKTSRSTQHCHFLEGLGIIEPQMHLHSDLWVAHHRHGVFGIVPKCGRACTRFPCLVTVIELGTCAH